MAKLRSRVLRAIIAKDLRDGLRDGRIVLALAFVVGAGLLMGLTSPDDLRTKATLAYWAEEDTRVPEMIQRVGEDVIDLRINRVATPDGLRDAVRDKRADLAIIIPGGFDAAVERGDEPTATAIVADPPTAAASAVVATVEPALRTLADQSIPATVLTESVGAPYRRGEAAVDEVGFRRFSGLLAIIGVMAMIGLFMVPMILAEETEKRTIEALAMAASYRLIVVAKALVGLVVAVTLTAGILLFTDLAPADPRTLVLALSLTALLFVGIGLLLGGLFTATTVNTWSGLLLVLVLAPAFMLANPPPWPGMDTLFTALPTSQAIRLALNGVSGEALFPDAWLSVLVLATWLLLIYAVLIRRLSTREP